MRALVLGDHLVYDSAYPDPVPPPGEALVKVRLAGICNTDLELVAGYMDFSGVLGHEFVGEVVSAPDPAWIGRRVVGDINAACYQCPTCRSGRHTHCPERTTLGIFRRDGAFADWLVLPQANLYPVPDGVPDEMAVFVEPLAAACEILEQVTFRPADRVIVLGDGKLGLLTAAVLRLQDVDLTLVGRHPNKLALAAAWGVPVLCDPGNGADRSAAGEDTGTGALASAGAAQQAGCASLPAGCADVVVECTGKAQGFIEARRLLRPRGTLVLKSTYHGDLTLNMSALVVDEITLIGSRCGPFATALRLLQSGQIDPRPLISAIFPLAMGETAFAHAVQPGVLKVLLYPRSV